MAVSKVACVLLRACVSIITNLLVWKKLTSLFCVACVGGAWIVVIARDLLTAALPVFARVINRTYIVVTAVFQAYLVNTAHDKITDVFRAFIPIAAADWITEAGPFEAFIEVRTGIAVVAFLGVYTMQTALLGRA